MKADKQIKTEATRKAKYLVFDLYYPPKDIYAVCSDGEWVRYLIQWVGGFDWEDWKKV